MEDIAGNGIPVKFISLIFRPAIITIHDYGNYMCNAKGETAHVTKGVSLNERGKMIISVNVRNLRIV